MLIICLMQIENVNNVIYYGEEVCVVNGVDVFMCDDGLLMIGFFFVIVGFILFLMLLFYELILLVSEIIFISVNLVVVFESLLVFGIEFVLIVV